MIALRALLGAVPSWCSWLLALVALCVGCEVHGRHAVQAKWDKAEAVRAAAEKVALDDRLESNRMLARSQAATNDRVSNDLKTAISQADSRVAAARRDGLRFAARCEPAGTTPALSAGRDPGAPAGTVQLPEPIANDLFDLAGDADRVVEQARACQAWIRQQGFSP